MTLKTGDWVEVRSKQEILVSLDSKGRLDGLPFMPEMFQYCGQRFKVYKRAHKTCDTVNGTGGRRLPGGIHLDLRCDGKAHGNCDAACLLFWKEAWLKPVKGPEQPIELQSCTTGDENGESASGGGCAEQDVRNATSRQLLGETRYVCQATELPHYTSRLRWWNIFQYVEDYRSGNVSAGRLIRGFVYASFSELCHRLSRLAPLLQWLYDRVQAPWGGIPYPRRKGTIPVGQATLSSTLNLQPGDLVRVKSYKSILETLDSANKNAGLFFDAELVPYCGGTYRVRARIRQFVDERSGEMSFLRTPAVILEHVWCQSRYSACRMLCPRSIYSWWREAWLERVSEEAGAVAVKPPRAVEEAGRSMPVGRPTSPVAAHLSSEPQSEARLD
ncbi:hypothetical protein [Dongia deserti]|uniref:hypothetical protein n=1 Tax=Dongia deserti TaxID=2268030 RepID=UPI0025482194|nr:hypothetical protein [Dongia deserti]